MEIILKLLKKYWKQILAILAVLLILILSSICIKQNYTNQTTTSALQSALTECETWKTADSLSVAKNDVLTLKLSDVEKYREEDLKTINSLKKKNEDLLNLTNTLSETNVQFVTEVKDSLVYVTDTVVVNYKLIDWSDEWATFNGVIDGDTLTATFSNKEELVCSETVVRKRFLGFLWKTKKIKEKNVIITSKNPHTTIKNVEMIEIEQ